MTGELTGPELNTHERVPERPSDKSLLIKITIIATTLVLGGLGLADLFVLPYKLPPPVMKVSLGSITPDKKLPVTVSVRADHSNFCLGGMQISAVNSAGGFESKLVDVPPQFARMPAHSLTRDSVERTYSFLAQLPAGIELTSGPCTLKATVSGRFVQPVPQVIHRIRNTYSTGASGSGTYWLGGFSGTAQTVLK